MSFIFTRGPITTEIPWFRPDPERLSRWRDKVLNTVNVDKYNIWIVGGVLEDGPTWDTDIAIQQEDGDLDFQEIEKTMISVTKIGFEERQLIDACFQVSPHRYLHPFLAEPLKHQAPLALEEFSNLNFQQEVLQIALETSKNGVVMKDRSSNPVRVSEHLWKVKKSFPNAKHIERKKRGITYTKTPVLVTANLNFKDIINSSRPGQQSYKPSKISYVVTSCMQPAVPARRSKNQNAENINK